MKVLLLSGSRNREGRTARAIDTIREGAEQAGAATETIFLIEHKIDHCHQCESDGWGVCRRDGYCIVKDDFQMAADKIKESDVVVFASPVYFQDITESMKSFLDRLRRITCFNPEPISAGTSAAGICLAGGGGNFAPRACYNLDSTLQMCRFDVIDMIPLRRQNFDIKLPMLKTIGAWLATKPVSNQE